MDEREATLDRVRKLLALAGSPNPHEAAAAAARAQALIDAWRLGPWLAADPVAGAEPVIDDRDAPLDVARRLRPWRVALAGALARANGCVVYTLQTGDEERLILVGRDGDRAAVHALWAWLLRRVEWASATAGPGRSRHWHEAFRVGAVDTVAERLAARHAEAGLVPIAAAIAAREVAVQRFVHEHLRLTPGRGLRVDGRGYRAGRRGGVTIPLPD